MFGILKEDDPDKRAERAEHVITLHSRLEELEQLLTATKESYFGGLM